MSILCSLHDADGFEHVRAGCPATMTLRMRNGGTRAVLVSTRRGSPRIVIDFGTARADVSLDPSRATGHFTARAASDGTLELIPAGPERWWCPKEILSAEFPEFRIDGAAGHAVITLRFEGFGEEADGTYEIVVLKLGAVDGGQASPQSAPPIAASWQEGPEVEVAKAAGSSAGELILRVDGTSGGGRYYLALSSGNAPGLGALVLPEDAHRLVADAGAAWNCDRIAESPRAVWAITESAETPDSLEISLRGIFSKRCPGFAHIVLYRIGVPGAADQYVVLPVVLTTATVSITSFTVNKSLLRNITQPETVLLSWQTRNASAVVLSTAGVVNFAQTEYPQTVEETTTFVLTAYDSAMDQVVSSSVTVTVDPPLASRLVPRGTIALWSGTAADIPPHWHLCDGTNGTRDLRDRFIMGAGPSATPPHSQGEEETHSHVVPAIERAFTTAEAGSHQHKFPQSWYQRKLAGGQYSSIDTNSDFSKNTKVQEAGAHTHAITVSTVAVDTGPNRGSVRPPWYALCYIMKGD